MPTPREGYRTKDGQKVPSVTTILGRFKDSGGLIKWAYKEGRTHENLAMRNLPAPAHLYDNVEKAALAGTIAHALVDAFIRDGSREGERFESTKEEYSTALGEVKTRAWNAYQQFRKWLNSTRMKVFGHERQLVSEKHRFGGTPDADGYEPDAVAQDANGDYVLIDWKTSNKVYGEMIVQLAAYAILIEEVDGKVVKGAHLLRFAKETADFAHHYYGELEREKELFLLYRRAYDIAYAVEKRA
jgi:hypothetical protein